MNEYILIFLKSGICYLWGFKPKYMVTFIGISNFTLTHPHYTSYFVLHHHLLVHVYTSVQHFLSLLLLSTTCFLAVNRSQSSYQRRPLLLYNRCFIFPVTLHVITDINPLMEKVKLLHWKRFMTHIPHIKLEKLLWLKNNLRWWTHTWLWMQSTSNVSWSSTSCTTIFSTKFLYKPVPEYISLIQLP